MVKFDHFSSLLFRLIIGCAGGREIAGNLERWRNWEALDVHEKSLNHESVTLITGSNPVLFTTVISLLFSVRVQNGDENKE